MHCLSDNTEDADYHNEEPLKLSFKGRGTWTSDEINFLLENYPLHGPDYCAEKLGRSYHACVMKYNVNESDNSAPRIYKKWTKEDEEFLLKNANVIGIKNCAKHLNVSEGACQMKFDRLTNV